MNEDKLEQGGEVFKNFPHHPFIALSAKTESELIDLRDEEREELLSSVGITEPALNKLARVAHKTLGLMTFLTAGSLEVRAWTVRKGATAPQAAGVIHTDFTKKFIKADVVNYQDFIDNNGWLNARNKGLVRSEGKEYIMKENDIVEFKIGA
jgi:ribosome-binding ATPase